MPFARSFLNKPLALFGVGIAILALPGQLPAQVEPEPQETSAQQTIESDMVFVAGEDLTVSAASTDDVFAAGGSLDANGARADHLFLAGGDITVTQAIASDIIVAGGEIRLNGAEVADDLIAAGGDIFATNGFGIGGSAVLAGGDVRFEAPVGGDLRIGAGEIFVNSAIAGTARLSGDTIVIGPNARIGGDLLYRTQNLTIDPGAVIEGRRAILPAPDRSAAEDFGKGVGQLFLLFGLSIVLSYFILVVLLVFAAPNLMRSASTMIRQKPWQSLGIGVIYALVVPLLVLLLVTTVIAAPLAILLIAISVALTPIALAVSAYFVGMSARRIATGAAEPPARISGRILWPLLGVLVVFGLTLIPLVGMVVWLLAMLFGLGAFARQASRALTARAAQPAS